METYMKIRTAVLASVAVMALSTTCFAQEYGDPRYGSGPPESTPSEMQQTQELNQQSLNGPDRQNSPYSAQSEYGGPPQADENAPMSDEAASPPPQAQYQDQQQQYNDRMQQYRDQQARYRNEHQRYAQDARAYDLARYAWSYPAPSVYHYGNEYGLRPLYLVAEPSQQLSQVPVEGPGGRWVGRVRNIETATDGQPRRVEIALNRRVSVWVQPGDLRFDPSEGILYTDLTRGQLWTMPGATVESAPL